MTPEQLASLETRIKEWRGGTMLTYDEMVELIAAAREGIDRVADKSLEVKDAGHKGRGVFATRDIKAGDTISEAPIMCLDQLHKHVWLRDGRSYLALAHHQFCNDPHPRPGDTANCTSDCDGKFDRLVAARDITAGEELTIDYQEEFGELGFTPVAAEPHEAK